MHIQKHCICIHFFSGVKDIEPNRGKANANAKINILMSENIGQRRLIFFFLESFDALYYYHFQSNYHHGNIPEKKM